MTVSQFKIENHRSITAEVADSQPLFDGSHANEGDKLIDAFLISDDGATETLIYMTPNQIGSFDIVEDEEYDVFLPLSEQKFKVKLK
jgi:hypothetical protein